MVTHFRASYKAKLSQAKSELKSLGYKAGYTSAQAMIVARYHIHDISSASHSDVRS